MLLNFSNGKMKFICLASNKICRLIGVDFCLQHFDLFSGIINVLTTTPLWVVNTRMKMAGINRQTRYKTLLGEYMFNIK